MSGSVGLRVGSIRLEQLLGQGGMGEVWLGHDEKLQRRVAVKTLQAETRLSPGSKARFLREARLLSRIGHPGLCQVHDLVETPGADYLVLEYVDGRTLRQALAEGLPPGRQLEVAEGIAEALAAAHREKVVHRDLKPDNVMLTAAGAVKVLDLGIARAFSDSPEPEPDPVRGDGDADGDATAAFWVPDAEPVGPPGVPTERSITLTRRGAVVGTLRYMSPEQAQGLPAGPEADVYSLGLILQEMTTGQPAYDGPEVQLEDVAAARTRHCPGLDPELLRLVTEATARDPQARPSAAQVAARLRWLRDRPRVLRRRRRLRQAAGLAVAALALVAVAVSYLAVAAESARRDAERRRAQAEGLITFMVGDLVPRLDELGRLDVLDEAGRRAEAYFDAVPEASLSDAERRGRVDALLLLGDVHRRRGELAPALATFGRAAALVPRGSPDLGWRRLEARCHEWLGQVRYDAGQFREAHAAWEATLAATEAVAAHPGAEIDDRRNLGGAWHNLGTVREALGELGPARDAYVRAIEVNRAAARQHPGNPDLEREQALTLAWLGSVQERLGEIDAALESRQSNLTILDALARSAPDNLPWRFDVGVAHLWLARLLAARADARAFDHFTRGLDAVEGLVRADPANREWLRYRLAARSDLGWAEVQGGRPGGRERLAATCRDIDREPLLPGWAPLAANCHVRLAEALGGRAVGRAVELCLQVDDPEVLATTCATAQVLLGRESREPARSAAWSRAAELLGPERPSEDWRRLAARARLELARGRPDRARPSLDRLQSLGLHDRFLEEWLARS